RIRERLEEEDFDQVPQLATSLLIELNQPFSLTTISLPAKPGTQAARGFDSGGASGPGTGGENGRTQSIQGTDNTRRKTSI
ncbi:unnamed protein product, partial [Durusdinium trenchii]